MAVALRALIHPPSSQLVRRSPSKLATSSSTAHFSLPLFSHRRSFSTIRAQVTALKPSKYVVKEDGRPETLEHRVFFFDSAGKKVSPWHDVPLQAGDGLLNFVVEIPKESSAKMEVATEEPYTPIKQDTKKGKLRFYPYNINWNYGLLPQTWEDPSHSNAEVEGAFGDNDPGISTKTSNIK